MLIEILEELVKLIGPIATLSKERKRVKRYCIKKYFKYPRRNISILLRVGKWYYR